MNYEQIVANAASFPSGKIPAMKAGLRQTEGAVTTNTGTPPVFMATFVTMLRTNTNPNDWITARIVVSPDTNPEVLDAHFFVYEEWKRCVPGRGMEVIEKYAPFFEDIQI